MNDTVSRVLEITGTAIILLLVLTHASEFGQVATSIGGVYVQGVQALQAGSSNK